MSYSEYVPCHDRKCGDFTMRSGPPGNRARRLWNHREEPFRIVQYHVVVSRVIIPFNCFESIKIIELESNWNNLQYNFSWQMRSTSRSSLCNPKIYFLRKQHVSFTAVLLCWRIVQCSVVYRRGSGYHPFPWTVHDRFQRDRDEISRGHCSYYTSKSTGTCKPINLKNLLNCGIIK